MTVLTVVTILRGLTIPKLETDVRTISGLGPLTLLVGPNAGRITGRSRPRRYTTLPGTIGGYETTNEAYAYHSEYETQISGA